MSLQAGEFDLAVRMVVVAEAGATEEAQRARTLLLRGQIAFASGQWADAPAILLSAANRLAALSLEGARGTYLDAWAAALFAGESAADSLLTASVASMSLPPADDPGPADILLQGLATLMTEGRVAAAPILRRATVAFAAADVPVQEGLRWGWLATLASSVLWDEQASYSMNVNQLAARAKASVHSRCCPST